MFLQTIGLKVNDNYSSMVKRAFKTSANEKEILAKLTNIGLEVEGVKENLGEPSAFKIAKIVKAEKHPNADKLKVCDVNIGGKETLKVVWEHLMQEMVL